MEFDLSSCGLQALPEGIGELTGLQKLNLLGNGLLRTLPTMGLGRLSELETFQFEFTPGLCALKEVKILEGVPALLAYLAAHGMSEPTDFLKRRPAESRPPPRCRSGGCEYFGSKNLDPAGYGL